MKRVVLLISVLIMLVSASAAFASDAHFSNGFSYEIKGNGTATIVGYEGSGDIIIPQMLDGYTVASIGNNAFYRDQIQKALVSVTIPETVKSIGDFSFWNMNIASINIPNSVEYIGKGAFVGCNDCTFRISPNHPKYAVIDGALYDKSKKELIKGKSSVKIPEGITSIGDYAYYEVCDCFVGGDGRVTGEYNGMPVIYFLPSTVTRIGDYAFAYSNISYTTYDRGTSDSSGRPTGGRYILPNETLQEIGDYAFLGFEFDYNGSQYRNPLHFTIPSSVKRIGIGCFKDTKCSWEPNVLLYIADDSQIREIPEEAFYDSIRVVCYANVEKIGKKALSYASICTINTSALNSIDEYAFANAYFCEASNSGIYYNEKRRPPQTLMYIPETCEAIPDYAFSNCNIKYVTLSEGVETIGKNAFQIKGGKIGKVHLPNSLTDIASDAFPLYTEYEVESGSYAQRWADENAFNYTVKGEEQNLDWLNN